MPVPPLWRNIGLDGNRTNPADLSRLTFVPLKGLQMIRLTTALFALAAIAIAGSAQALPIQPISAADHDTILVRGGHGGGHGHGHGHAHGNRGRHLGWYIGRHRGWSHSHRHWHW
jgi:hypothetical protein